MEKGLKECNDCKKIMELSNFQKQKKIIGHKGYSNLCKKCYKNRYRKPPERKPKINDNININQLLHNDLNKYIAELEQVYKTKPSPALEELINANRKRLDFNRSRGQKLGHLPRP